MYAIKEFTNPELRTGGFWFAGAVITDFTNEENVQFKFAYQPTSEEIINLVNNRISEMNAPTPALIPKTDFMSRFTNSELGALFLSTDENVISIIQMWQDPSINNIDLNLDVVKQSVNYLASVNLIEVNRIVEILAVN
jgi:hypothetical protein